MFLHVGTQFVGNPFKARRSFDPVRRTNLYRRGPGQQHGGGVFAGTNSTDTDNINVRVQLIAQGSYIGQCGIVYGRSRQAGETIVTGNKGLMGIGINAERIPQGVDGDNILDGILEVVNQGCHLSQQYHIQVGCQLDTQGCRLEGFVVAFLYFVPYGLQNVPHLCDIVGNDWFPDDIRTGEIQFNGGNLWIFSRRDPLEHFQIVVQCLSGKGDNVGFAGFVFVLVVVGDALQDFVDILWCNVIINAIVWQAFRIKGRPTRSVCSMMRPRLRIPRLRRQRG
mmetsp:Transcript_12739/g.24475  ORF Transcript_12739/g.24475 Transcript_12739/m.24475 type:complete len:280 (-) Transcript_12739:194-1033(-)